MSIRFVLPVLFALGLASTASADRFHLGSKETAQKITEGTADYVDGVLLREEGDNYVIRVEGGEMQLQKASVWKIEKTDLTVAQIEQIEKDRADALAQADAKRRVMLGSAAEARMARIREVRAAEAAATRDSAAASQREDTVGYDPVLHTAIQSDVGGIVNATVQRELGGVIRPALERELRDVRRSLRESLRR
ncbi:MAG: hypothetical protein U1F36_02085 [Planctomycetota bacterium]